MEFRFIDDRSGSVFLLDALASLLVLFELVILRLRPKLRRKVSRSSFWTRHDCHASSASVVPFLDQFQMFQYDTSIPFG